jgi:hypothetical protein
MVGTRAEGTTVSEVMDIPKVVEDQLRSLQERVVAAERERDEAYALLRVFGREHTHAEIAPRSAFARAAELAAAAPLDPARDTK